MAKTEELLDLLKNGVEKFNQWRIDNPSESIILNSAFLVKFNLNGVNFQNAKLYEAVLMGADLRNANLKDARLYNAYLMDVDLRNANLEGANLQEADLKNADLRAANLKSAKLCNAILDYAKLEDAKLEESDLRNANLYNATLNSTDLTNAELVGTILRKTNLRNSILVDSMIRDIILKRTIFNGAIIDEKNAILLFYEYLVDKSEGENIICQYFFIRSKQKDEKTYIDSFQLEQKKKQQDKLNMDDEKFGFLIKLLKSRLFIVISGVFALLVLIFIVTNNLEITEDRIGRPKENNDVLENNNDSPTSKIDLKIMLQWDEYPIKNMVGGQIKFEGIEGYSDFGDFSGEDGLIPGIYKLSPGQITVIVKHPTYRPNGYKTYIDIRNNKDNDVKLISAPSSHIKVTLTCLWGNSEPIDNGSIEVIGEDKAILKPITRGRTNLVLPKKDGIRLRVNHLDLKRLNPFFILDLQSEKSIEKNVDCPVSTKK